MNMTKEEILSSKKWLGKGSILTDGERMQALEAMQEYADLVAFEALEALCGMWEQYCPRPYGHMCMSAGERAEWVLSKYGLLKNDNGYGGEVDWDKLKEYEESVQKRLF